MAHSQEVKDKAIRLRVEERLDLLEISQKLEISKATASIWLRGFPLQRNRANWKLSDKTRNRMSSAQKGKTHSKETREKIRASAIGRNHSEATKRKMSISAKERGLGGNNPSSRVFYKMVDGSEIRLDSSYELKVAQELDENNIDWIRPKRLPWVDDEGVKHHYYPDFYLLDYDVYLDPKNWYLISRHKRKIELVSIQNKVKIIILNEDQLNWNSIYQMIMSAIPNA